MKISFLCRASFLGLILWAAATHGVRAQGADFKIINIHQTTSFESIQVGSSWRKDLPKRMQVSLLVTADTPSSAAFVKAYFYDKDDKLVGSSAKPNKIWTSTPRGTEEVSLPPVLTHGKITDVYFALPEDLQAKKWTTMLVVFGNDAKVVATSLPNSALPKLDFPEKSKLAPAK